MKEIDHKFLIFFGFKWEKNVHFLSVSQLLGLQVVLVIRFIIRVNVKNISFK